MSDIAPPTLRDDVLGRALEQRAPGRPVDAPDPATPLDALRGAAAQLEEVLRSLQPDDWTASAHDEIGSVRALVEHLVGVERLALGWVTAPADATFMPIEHVAAARSASADLGALVTGSLVTEWADAVTRTIDACAIADPAKPLLANDLPTDVDGFLVLRAFELWAHTLDVCRATGRPVPVVEPARLSLMSTRLMDAVPVALALRGATVGAPAVRFVLTGDGGGVHDVVLGETGREPLLVVVDTVDVCLVAARRLDPEALDVTIEGDADDVRTLLAALDAFARD